MTVRVRRPKKEKKKKKNRGSRTMDKAPLGRGRPITVVVGDGVGVLGLARGL